MSSIVLLLNKYERKLWLEIGWTPHSPRSGFASELIAAGVSFTEVRERGRWVADSSLRTYIDVVSAAGISVSLRLSGLAEAIAFAQARFLDFFPAAKLFCKEARKHGRQGFSQGTGRSDVSALGHSVGAGACGLPQEITADEDGHPSSAGFEGARSGAPQVKARERAPKVRALSKLGRGRGQASQSPLVHSSHPQAPPTVLRGRGGRRGSSR